MVVRGRAYLAKGDRDKAIADFTKAIRLDPKRADGYCSLLPLRTRRRATRTGRLPITVRRYALGPDSWKAYNNRGEVYLRKGDFDKAIADENTAISLSPELAAPYSNRGQAYLAKGDLDKAIADENESVRLDPRDGEAFDARGLAYQRKGDTSKAEADFALRKGAGLQVPGWHRRKGLKNRPIGFASAMGRLTFRPLSDRSERWCIEGDAVHFRGCFSK